MIEEIREQYENAVRALTKSRLLRCGLCEGVWNAELETEFIEFKRMFAKLREEAGRRNCDIPMEKLFQIFCLDEFECHCVMMAYMLEVETEYCVVSGKMTIEMLSLSYETVFDIETLYAYFKDKSVLCYFLLRPAASEESFMKKRFRMDESVLDFLLTGGQISEANCVIGNLSILNQLEKPIGLSSILDFLEKISLDKKDRIITLTGDAGSGRKFCIEQFCQKHAIPVLWIDGKYLEEKSTFFEKYTAAIVRECVLYQAIPVFCDMTEQQYSGLAGAKEKLQHMFYYLTTIFVTSKERIKFGLDGKVEELFIDMPVFSYEEQLQMWKSEGKHYLLSEQLNLEEMPNRFSFVPGQIKKAFTYAGQFAAIHGRAKIEKTDMQEGCRRILEHIIVKKAIRVKPGFEWEELVLPPTQKKQLKMACNHVLYRHQVYDNLGFAQKMPYGKGVSMVFSGLPGTGKTMAVQVIASELGLELYKINLAAVVSKYVGDTEKNLEEIFEQARKSQVILFFDEADVLFSKRTEVKDSNDKYSNMEAAYMLQKIEEYDGVTILATNYLQNFDEAFRRRMKYIIDFPLPDEEYRFKIWQMAFPEKALAEDLDLRFFARNFELSGSNIKNIVLQSAFFAVSENRAIHMQHVIAALRMEYAKIGKILSKEDMGEYCIYYDS